MATGITAAGANSALDTAISGTVFIKLHIGDPGAAATANAAVNTTRIGVTFAAAASAAKATNSAALWSSVSTTETYTHFSIWSLVSGGTFLWSGTVSGGAVTAGQDFNIASAALSLSIAGAA